MALMPPFIVFIGCQQTNVPEPVGYKNPQLAESVSTPERQEADINRQSRLIGNFKVCVQSRL